MKERETYKRVQKDTNDMNAPKMCIILFTFSELLSGFRTNQEISQEELGRGTISLKGQKQILACLLILQNKPIQTCFIVGTDAIKRYHLKKVSTIV